MFDGGVDASEEFLADVYADGRGFERLAEVDVVEAGFGVEEGGVQAAADAAEAAADDSHEGAGHA